MAATDYDFSRTRSEIIQRAFRIVGALSLGESLSAEQSEQGVEVLNALVKSWQTGSHTFLWTEVVHILPIMDGYNETALAAGTALDDNILALSSAMYSEDAGTTRRPLRLITLAEWRAKDLPFQPGKVEEICLDLTTKSVRFWPMPNVSAQLDIVAIQRLKDFDTPGGAGDIPVQYIQALTFGLADMLAWEYGVPATERAQLHNQALEFLQQAKASDHDREDYTFVKGAFE